MLHHQVKSSIPKTKTKTKTKPLEEDTQRAGVPAGNQQGRGARTNAWISLSAFFLAFLCASLLA